AIAVAREGDPLSVRRKSRQDIACGMHRQPTGLAAIVIDDPDIAQVAEADLAIVIIRVPGQLDRPCGELATGAQEYAHGQDQRWNSKMLSHDGTHQKDSGCALCAHSDCSLLTKLRERRFSFNRPGQCRPGSHASVTWTVRQMMIGCGFAVASGFTRGSSR